MSQSSVCLLANVRVFTELPLEDTNAHTPVRDTFCVGLS
jgi:hypothetical protein